MVNDKANGSGREIELLLECMDQLKKAKLNVDVKKPDEQEMQKDFLEVQSDSDSITHTTLGKIILFFCIPFFERFFFLGKIKII